MLQNIRTQRVLVTGGCGYIGSHFVHKLMGGGVPFYVIDNLSRGHRSAVPSESLAVGDIGDRQFVAEVVRDFRPTVVVHFAAYAYVGESQAYPALYYENNVMQTFNLLEELRGKVPYFVFSSSCATYGRADKTPIDEATPQFPINAYGETKLVIERMLGYYGTAYGISSVSLRYFNAAGAEPNSNLVEKHSPETHLIPLAINAAYTGTPLCVFGSDYDTADGTCVRDYIHVNDLAHAHLLAVSYLASGGASEKLNLGIGMGYSVRQVIEVVQEVTGKAIMCTAAPRRPGDPPTLVARADRAREILGWTPRYGNLRDIVRTAVDAHQLLSHC